MLAEARAAGRAALVVGGAPPNEEAGARVVCAPLVSVPGDLAADRVVPSRSVPESCHVADDVLGRAGRARHGQGIVVSCDDVGNLGVPSHAHLGVLGHAGLPRVCVGVAVHVDAGHAPLRLRVGAPREVQGLTDAAGGADRGETTDAPHGLVNRDGVHRAHVEDVDPIGIFPIVASPDEAAAGRVDVVVTHGQAERPGGERAALGPRVEQRAAGVRRVEDRADDPRHAAGEVQVVHPGDRVHVVDCCTR
mmetsp:Transcript_54046/g.169961  ORF Transcript_54046/g.169961 Transcript_54046/m.169961 type:complete len:249 (+) Transcript_54046:680-1426(+)